VFEPGCLADYLARSELLAGAVEADQLAAQPPVFVPADVWEQGHTQARRGGERESAAMWTGRLFRDSQAQAVFVLVDACLEAEHASEEALAVTFSGQTWARLGEALRLRRRHLNHPHERLLGAVHGHNFKPAPDADGRLACESCAVARVCQRTTARLSAADQVWHQAVFAGQPWAVAVIWGHSARGEDWRMYGLADAQLTARPVHLLRS
jgi:hypothetical protein